MKDLKVMIVKVWFGLIYWGSRFHDSVLFFRATITNCLFVCFDFLAERDV